MVNSSKFIIASILSKNLVLLIRAPSHAASRAVLSLSHVKKNKEYKKEEILHPNRIGYLLGLSLLKNRVKHA
jgi:hypothetical protein